MDYWSNYFELDELEETDSHSIINCLRRHFASHGIPDEVVTDNGPKFISKNFAEFTRKWMFKHVKTSPYYSQVNGMAESAIKTAKTLLRSAIASGQDAWMAVLTYRNTPTPGMSTSPAQRLMSRKTKTLLPQKEVDLLPNVSYGQDCKDRKRKTIEMC